MIRTEPRIQDAATRSASLFDQHRRETYRSADRLFAGLMVLQWLTAIATALWTLPTLWEGGVSLDQPILRMAVLRGLGIILLPVALAILLSVREMRSIARRQAEAEASSEHRFENLVNSVDMVVWEADARTSEFTFVSRYAEKLLGYPVSQWLSEPDFWKERLQPADRVHVTAFRSAELSLKEPHTLEYRLIASNGRTVWVRDSATAALRKGDRLVRRGVMTDVTERKRIEQIKNEFIAMVSHELRTPLTSIHGSLGLMAGGIAGQLSPQARQLVDVAHRSSERLVRLTGDILDVEKMEAGNCSLRFESLELMPLIRQAVEANRAYAAKFSVKLEIDHALPGARIRGDADRLTQVLTNLISNACKFSPPDASVSVSACRRGAALRVIVRDCGPGIPEEFRKRIFQKFAQADSPANRKKGGNGLGLAIAKGIVEMHGGKIAFETKQGVGTSFFFDLPEWKPAAEAPVDLLGELAAVSR